MKYILLLSLYFFIFARLSFAQSPITSAKLITVDTTKQRMYIWEGGQQIRKIIVSTGMYYTPTIKGTFNILKKVDLQDMSGYFPPYRPYYIKDVPYVMYFYGAYAIHGTNWHTKFGTRYSHGCVNLSVPDAQWLYSWADVGTRIDVF